MILVVISGAAGSGKTVFSKMLLNKIRQDSTSCQLIDMDNYYKERDALTYPDMDVFRQEPSVYLPTHLCLQQLCDDLTSLSQGQSIDQKELIFETNFYKKDKQGNCVLKKTDHAEIIIMEGIFAQYFANTYLSAQYPLISVNVANSCYLNLLKARVERDTVERGLTRAQVYANEHKFVGPVFFNYTAKNTTGSDVYVLNDHEKEHLNDASFAEGIQSVLEEIKKIKESLQSNQRISKRTRPDALQMARRSHAIVEEQNVISLKSNNEIIEKQRAGNAHPRHEMIQALKIRSQTFGSFFKSPVMEMETDSQPSSSEKNIPYPMIYSAPSSRPADTFSRKRKKGAL